MRAITGIGLACLAAVLRNMICRRQSACLADQFIVSETVFGFFYFFAWSGQWPGMARWLACALFALCNLASIKAYR